MASILIVEDEQVLGESCREALTIDGYDAHWVDSAENAIGWLDQKTVDLCLIDINLPGMNGLELLKKMVEEHPETANIIMTARGDIQTAVKAMRTGAVDFLEKPLDLDTLSEVVKRDLKQKKIAQTLAFEQKHRTQEFGLHQIIGDCPKIQQAKTMVRRLSCIAGDGSVSTPSVLITGPTGTGKDLLARAIHYEGPRRSGPFVHINCAAIPHALLESELFGHARGAFTSAQSAKRGLFEVADEGTLFLDELGMLDLPLQAKILTAIESGKIRPVGSTAESTVNVQFVAAMNQDPEKWIAEGKMREDLYHRLRVVLIELPALATRGDDIEKLAQHFLAIHSRKFGFSTRKLTPAARAAIRQYHWPGNIRELAHRLESAVLLSEKEEIGADFLPAAVPQTVDDVERDGIDIDFSRGSISLESVELALIKKALSATGSNVTRAANLLSISRDTLRYRMEKYDINSRKNGMMI
ncbi:MAG: sigma-54-dependent transcriptional regulator [Planctomycetota bacterium]|jgi:DNA-binding NtrC family response regulator